ncbi:hypothetical protein [Yersinia phage fHe-Yen9-03]|uniref:Uncharacterized protein n=1 Tax=Yersinia phage fHe-Yen9-03 TaxID=2052743 RepID=A0A2C9CZ62_9CAUD|nr:hypothetical protein [Yersinia phage fHe-Yen9-03]
MNSNRKFTIAFWGGQAIGAVGVAMGCYFMMEFNNFWYFVGTALAGLLCAFIFINFMYRKKK